MGRANISRRTAFSLVAGAGLLALTPAAFAAGSPAGPAPRLVSVPVGRQPQAVTVNPVTGTAFVANTGDRTITIVQGGRAVATVGIPGRPSDLAVDPATGLVHVANSTSGTTVVVDPATSATVTIIPSGDGSSVLALDQRTYSLYVGSGDQARVGRIDLFGGVIRNTIEGPGKGFAAAVIDERARAGYFASLQTGSIEILDLATDTFTKSIPVGDGPSGIALHRRTGRVYVANSGIHHLSVIDGATRGETRTILLRSEASSVAVHERSNTVYANGGPDGLVRIDGARGEITGELTLGINPGNVAVDQRTGAVYVTDPLRDRLHVVTGF
ncbi:YncE family protein [Amycolatopsis endophytica]|uniref:DNA-binding beta-propeller fold protein YncE n=1 Tax=Amycolatopsis endophytica TaxID=860233 RepID=A0A853AYQ0_9PSEU|nr:YncE family protein [Amycolatopsis endophytica]NYI87903.1 DNA-binding beta-propeller fold protein YncE [Amycolatopsis endophytica]